MAGFISRIIFIRLSWDRSDNFTHAYTDVDVGVMFANKRLVICMCVPGSSSRSCSVHDAGTTVVINETACVVRLLRCSSF